MPPPNIDPVEYGRLQQRLDTLEDMVQELRSDMKELLAAVENARGGWRTLLLFGGACATLGGALLNLLPMWVKK